MKHSLLVLGVTGFAAVSMFAGRAAVAAAPVVDQSTAATPVHTAPAASDTVSLRKQLADLTLEIGQLQAELRDLRGQIETQTHELESLKTRNREALADMDNRLREQERRSAPAAPNSGAPANGAGKAAMPLPTPAEQQEYDAAFGLMKQGYYEKASKSFREFIAKHPSNELTGHAQYWVGEAQYVARNFKPALEEFTKVVDRYPSSPKVADALLKIGYCQHELGNLDKAHEALAQVISRYPNTSTAKSAEKRLADVKVAEQKQKAAEPKPKTKTAEAKTKARDKNTETKNIEPKNKQ